MSGLAGLVLAFALFQSTQCTAVNFDVDHVTIHCDGESLDRQIEQSKWPTVWHQPHLTAKYNAALQDGKLIPIATPAPEGLFEGVYARSLKENQRWRIRPAQYPLKP